MPFMKFYLSKFVDYNSDPKVRFQGSANMSKMLFLTWIRRGVG